MSRYRAIAKRGAQYIVNAHNDKGQLLDVGQGIIGPVLPIQQLLKWGYWQPSDETIEVDGIQEVG